MGASSQHSPHANNNELLAPAAPGTAGGRIRAASALPAPTGPHTVVFPIQLLGMQCIYLTSCPALGLGVGPGVGTLLGRFGHHVPFGTSKPGHAGKER